MIGGNSLAVLQQKGEPVTNALSEKVHTWVNVSTLWGWLDLSSGESKYSYNAKLQESTHIFLADYTAIDQKADDKRLMVNGDVYDVLLIDDPMGLHQHLEIYLKYVGR